MGLILVVDDDALMRRSLGFNLEQAGYQVSSAGSAEDALSLAHRTPPNLVLLDIGLPGMDGLDALRHFKSELGVPVIFLTARRRELDEVVGLELGADDYVTKPFDMDVLLAHIKAVLRRSNPPAVKPSAPAPLVVGDLVLDPQSHTVMIGANPVELTPREFNLLRTFAGRPRSVFSINELLKEVWGPEFLGESQVVYVHIRWLREKIEDDPNKPKRILTVRSVGYKLEPQ